MTENNFWKDMMGLIKTNVDASLQSMSMMQEQTEKMTRLMVDQGTAMQGEAKKFFDEWLNSAKSQQKSYQEALQSHLKNLEEFIGKSRS
jgi:polyhydroxyalkanoate synthesis regulator phasin